MPVISKSMGGIIPGDHVRLTYFTRQSAIHICEDDTLGFIDEGLRYERLAEAGWDLLYEDFPEAT